MMWILLVLFTEIFDIFRRNSYWYSSYVYKSFSVAKIQYYHFDYDIACYKKKNGYKSY